MRIFVALFLMCWAAEGLAAEGQTAEDDSLSLLQTRMGVNETDEADHDVDHALTVDEVVGADLAAPSTDNNLDHALEGKGTPRRRRRSRRRRSRRRRTRRRRTPSPTPAPTPVCNGISINQFKGEKFSVSQTSTYHGRATYTYDIEIGGEIHQKTSDAGDYFIGTHSSYGDMIEYFRNGARCGSTPRQADVTYTVGPTLELKSAQETSMCVYKFTIQLPESKCGLPMTPLDDLDTNNEDGENEQEEEIQAEEEGSKDCKKWCNSKKHKNKCWHKLEGGCPSGTPTQEPFKCGWFDCADCDECK